MGTLKTTILTIGACNFVKSFMTAFYLVFKYEFKLQNVSLFYKSFCECVGIIRNQILTVFCNSCNSCVLRFKLGLFM